MNAIEQIMIANQAASKMLQLQDETNRQILLRLAAMTEAATAELLSANRLDLEKMSESDPRYDRLQLTPERIKAIANDIRNVAALPSPVGAILEQRCMPNGLQLKKIRVPLGVVGVIYEARPNVTFDVFSLCFRTGNVTVLKGGSDAEHSNLAIISVINRCLADSGLSTEVVQLLPAERSAADALMNAVGLVDVLIPRGSQGLIDNIRKNSRIPVIETGAGVVHTYFDSSGDTQMGRRVIFNAKTRRVSVCNALDCLIIHNRRLNDLFELVADLAGKNVEILADDDSYRALADHYPQHLLRKASVDDFGKEHLAYRLTIKTVADIDAALAHISRFSTRHSEAIIADDSAAKDRFCKEVDAAAVYVNTSTAFTDGAQFGMGAEIGISTQKLHARGPMALPELTTYKWIIESEGLTRP
jgi:glutamate-5-semialdehyde dehydrogenase